VVGVELIRRHPLPDHEPLAPKPAVQVTPVTGSCSSPYRRYGFVEEGRLRDSIEIAGRWHDDIVMAILADDFEAPGHPLP